MSVNEILDAIRALPAEEQDELFGRIEDEFFFNADDLTPEQVAELDRCAEEYIKALGIGIPWKQVQAELEEQFGLEDIELPPEAKAELDRRAEKALKNPGQGAPTNEITAEVKAKRGAKGRK